MNAEASRWVALSERKPTEADLPVVWAKDGNAWGMSFGGMGATCFRDSTHWLPIPAPPKPKTQRETDEEAFERFYYEGNRGFSKDYFWHAALAWERSRKQT